MTGEVEPPPRGAVAGEATRRTLIVPLIVGFAILMQTLDSSLVAVALPTMAEALNQDPLTMNLALTAYFVGAAVFLPISGWAADRFGARTVFSVSIIVFAVSSLACGLSQGLVQLIVARTFQGFAGAMLMPVGRLVLLRTAPKAELIRAVSVLTIPALLGPVLGPPLAGVILTVASWRWVFLINIPIAVAGLYFVNRYIANIREENAAKLDVRGFMLSAIALSGLAVGLSNLGRTEPPPAVAAALVVTGLVFSGLYFLHARRRLRPIIELSLFQVLTFRLTAVGGLFTRMTIGATPYLLALLLQVAFGMSPLAAGMLTFATAAGALLMRTTAMPIIRRVGFRRLMVVNGVLTGASLMLCAVFTPDTPHGLILLVLAGHGFLRSLQLTCLNSLAYADLESEQMSSGSTIMGIFQQLSQSLGIGLCATVVAWVHGMRGGGGVISTADVTPAFIAVAAVSLLSIPFYLRLPRRAGAEMIGEA